MHTSHTQNTRSSRRQHVITTQALIAVGWLTSTHRPPLVFCLLDNLPHTHWTLAFVE